LLLDGPFYGTGVPEPPIFQLRECYPTDAALFEAFKSHSVEAGHPNAPSKHGSRYVVMWYEHYVLKLFEGERLWERCRDENNQYYYHNKKTGKTVREKPDDVDALLDPAEEVDGEDGGGLSPLCSPTSVAAPIGSMKRQLVPLNKKASRKLSSVGMGSTKSKGPKGSKSPPGVGVGRTARRKSGMRKGKDH
jgi:hypothetical protein